jgi:hypothetical protein
MIMSKCNKRGPLKGCLSFMSVGVALSERWKKHVLGEGNNMNAQQPKKKRANLAWKGVD